MTGKSAAVKDFYESTTWKFHEVTNLYERIRLQNLSDFLRPEPTDIILDIGCGGGTYTVHLAEMSTVVATDISSKAVRNAKENVNHSRNAFFLVADAAYLPIKDSSADKATCVDVLEHVENPERFLRETARVLKPSGRVSIFTACGENRLTLEYILKPLLGRFITSIRLKMGHLQVLDTAKLDELLRPNFVIVRIQYMHHWVGWFLKFLWDVAHVASSGNCYTLGSSENTMFHRALWLMLEAEYRLLQTKSMGSEIVVNAVRRSVD